MSTSPDSKEPIPDDPKKDRKVKKPKPLIPEEYSGTVGTTLPEEKIP